MTGVDPAELAEHAFVAGLAPTQLRQLASLAVATQVPTGQRLFDEGGHAANLWLIRTGRIALDLRVPGRDRLIVETLGPGDELGLSWLMRSARWQFGAIAQAAADLYEISSATLTDLCESDHELGYQLTRKLLTTAVGRLQAARIRILDVYAAPPPRVEGAP